MSYTSNIIHLVFVTKNRKRVFLKENREELFKVITKIIKNHNCFLYVINGVEDHIHILLRLHPGIAMSDLVKDIKLTSSKFIKEKKLFPDFDYWATGYYGFSCSKDHRYNLIAYIKNQEQHHSTNSGKQELIQLLDESEVEYDLKYVE